MIAALALLASALNATPQTVNAVIAKAPSGATINLAPGTYGVIDIRGRNWPRPITLNMGKAQIRSVWIRSSSGISIVGGTYSGSVGKAMEGYGIWIRQSSHVTITEPVLTDSVRGIVLDRAEDIAITKAQLLRMQVDGINVGSSRRVRISDSVCSDFRTDDRHPDCMQLWSSPKYGVTQDVELLNNVSEGNMQGFTGFNHVRNGVDDGGFDRIKIVGNRVFGTYPHGVSISDCRDCTITDNITRTAPGARWRVSVNIGKCTRCTIRNNVNGLRPPRR